MGSNLGTYKSKKSYWEAEKFANMEFRLGPANSTNDTEVDTVQILN